MYIYIGVEIKIVDPITIGSNQLIRVPEITPITRPYMLAYHFLVDQYVRNVIWDAADLERSLRDVVRRREIDDALDEIENIINGEIAEIHQRRQNDGETATAQVVPDEMILDLSVSENASLHQ